MFKNFLRYGYLVYFRNVGVQLPIRQPCGKCIVGFQVFALRVCSHNSKEVQKLTLQKWHELCQTQQALKLFFIYCFRI